DHKVTDRALISKLLVPVITKLADLHKAERDVESNEESLAKARAMPETNKEEKETKEIYVRMAQHGCEWSAQRLEEARSYRQKVIEMIAAAHPSVKEFVASELPDLI